MLSQWDSHSPQSCCMWPSLLPGTFLAHFQLDFWQNPQGLHSKAISQPQSILLQRILSSQSETSDLYGLNFMKFHETSWPIWPCELSQAEFPGLIFIHYWSISFLNPLTKQREWETLFARTKAKSSPISISFQHPPHLSTIPCLLGYSAFYYQCRGRSSSCPQAFLKLSLHAKDIERESKSYP